MNKWYHPFGLLLVAAMVGDLSGCAQTSGWLAKKPAKKTKDEKVASSDKKPGRKTKNAKSTKDVADAKPGSKSGLLNGKVAKSAKSKATDADHDKLASAEPAKKNTPTVDAAVAKTESARPDKVDVVKNESTASQDSKATKPAKTKPRTDEDLDAFLAQMETPTAPNKSAAKKSAAEEPESSTENSASARKNIIPVNKEVAKDQESDFADWANVKDAPNSNPAKTAKSNAVEDEEWDASSSMAARSSARPTKEMSTEDSVKETSRPSRKNVQKTDAAQGMQAMCPQAGPELRDVLKGMTPDDPESLKQGLHRIGQLRREAAAATPLFKKMLTHDEPFVRLHAALAMARLNLTTAESVAVVTDSLKSRNASLRSFAVAVLGEMGPRSSDVLKSLAESLNDRDGQIRLRAAEVLIRHEEWAYPALQSLLACLKDKDENVRWLTTYSLAELAPESPEAIQALLKTAHDPVSKVRVGAVYAIGEIGPYAKRSIDELRRLQESTRDEELKSAISHTIAQINKETQ